MTTTHATTVSHTTTISSSDVRQVMRLVSMDVQAICQAAAHAALAFDLDDALTDISILVLNGVICGINLHIHLDNVVVREYSFVLKDAPSASSGPPAGQPPLGYVPAGAAIRLSVTPDTRTPEAERQAWFARLGWSSGTPLTYPQGATHSTYGSFGSGGLSVQRQLMTNPRYDRAAS